MNTFRRVGAVAILLLTVAVYSFIGGLSIAAAGYSWDDVDMGMEVLRGN